MVSSSKQPKKSDFSAIIAKEKPLPKVKKPPYKVPKWFSRLPTGSHGSTPSQKKAWKVVSDYVRERDWNESKYCRDGCGTFIENWKDADCGHFKSWSVCHGLFKYELKNLALQASNCNRRSDGVVGYGLANYLIHKYGSDHLEWIERENEKYRGKKIEEWELVEMVAKLRPYLVV